MRTYRPCFQSKKNSLSNDTPSQRDTHVLNNIQHAGSAAPRKVLRRCQWGYPQVVLANATKGHSGDKKTVSSTMVWLTCPRVKDMVSKLEQHGGVKQYEKHTHTDTLHQDYEVWHQFLQQHLDPEEFRQWSRRRIHGNAGVRHASSIKCLHAHTAAFMAGADIQLGRDIVEELCEKHRVSNLDCPADHVSCDVKLKNNTGKQQIDYDHHGDDDIKI